MKKWSLLILAVFAIFSSTIHSQSSNVSQLQKKIALVIGNGNYQSGSILANTENDASSMEIVLEKLGFVVYKYENVNQNQMKYAIDEFGAKLKFNDVGLFYYAGHGIQSNGYNYLVPIDAQLKTESQVEYDCVQADRVLGLMESSGTKVNILILDACRNNPFERSWNRSTSVKGLAFMNAPKGTLIAYATAPGNTASDGSGNNGLYTSAILESIVIPKITILQMFQQVRSIVSDKSNNNQIPWESTSLTGDFYFNQENFSLSEVQTNNQNSNMPIESNINNENYLIDSRDQQHYKIVILGSYIWMAENLKSIRYNDGTPIPQTIDKIAWSNLTTPSYCWYDNQEAYKISYGALYNWPAINSGKLCPVGWHIPTEIEWDTLVALIGGDGIAGGSLKERGTEHWKSPNSNRYSFDSNFKALPGGYRNENGDFKRIGLSGFWWTSYDGVQSVIRYRNLEYDSRSIYKRNYKDKPIGFSVRCVKDY